MYGEDKEPLPVLTLALLPIFNTVVSGLFLMVAPVALICWIAEKEMDLRRKK
jgi:hypothetical protein